MQWNDPLLNGMHVMNLISDEWRYIKLITYNNVTMLTWIRINIGKGTEIDTEKYPVKVTNLAIINTKPIALTKENMTKHTQVPFDW